MTARKTDRVQSIDRLKRQTAALSVASNSFLILSKLVVGYFTGSVGILSEAVHSGIDLLAAVVAYFSVILAARPATRKHPSGLGKIESISGALEAALIFGAAMYIVYEAGQRLLNPRPLKAIEWGMAVMIASILVNLGVSRRLYAVAKRTESIALEADAAHLSTDVLSSAGVLAGLFLVNLTGRYVLDPIVAIGMALVICKAAYELTVKSVADLLDVKLSDEQERAILDILEKHKGKLVGHEILRSRRAGNAKFVDLNLVVCRHDSLVEAHRLADHIEERIGHAVPRTAAHIHVEPCDLSDIPCPRCEDRSQEEKQVLEILKRHKDQFVESHDFHYRREADRTFIEFHVALCRNDTVSEAHDVCEMLEGEIAQKFPDAKITVHVDPCDIVSDFCHDGSGKKDGRCHLKKGGRS